MSVRFALRYLERDIWFFSGSLLPGEDGNAMLSPTLTASSQWVGLHQDWGIFGEQMWCTEPAFSQQECHSAFRVLPGIYPKKSNFNHSLCPVLPSHCAQERWEEQGLKRERWKSCAVNGILGWTAVSRMCCRTEKISWISALPWSIWDSWNSQDLEF